MFGGLLDDTLGILEKLVACDTRNPPRRPAESDLVDVLAEALGASFEFEVRDHGGGCISLFAVRGAPKLLINCHLDTVPADPGWQRDPFRLSVEGTRAFGLGSCDIKGAGAALLAALQQTDPPAAVLFTTDEEAGPGRGVPAFVARALPFDGVIVSEPTGCRAVTAHRGIATVAGTFSGVAGHSSLRRALDDSALHHAVAWGAAAVELAREHEQLPAPSGLPGIRFNLGQVEGGLKPNMIASTARLVWGCGRRPTCR